jgi:hypothetical protein
VVISEENESLRKCDWCGKSGISPMWSGRKSLYCSFRCSAAGSSNMYAALATILTCIVSMVIILGIMMQMGSSSGGSAPLILLVPQAGLVVICTMTIYATYIGRFMRKERELSQSE